MINFLSDTKIDSVNAKFVTSILSETINILTLLHSTQFAESRKNDENENITISTAKVENINLTKLARNVNNIKSSLNKVITEVGLYQNITDFSGISVAERESNFLDEYNQNKIALEEQRSMLSEVDELIANHRRPTETVDESVIKCAVRNRFIKTWEKARKDQNDHFYRILIDNLQDEINKYARKIEFENRCILEIENYSLSEMEMQKAESIRWLEKFDIDINKTEIDIQMSMAALEAMKMNYEKTEESIKYREQEMKDFITLKEDRILRKDSELMKLIYNHRSHLLAKCQIFDE